MSHPVPVTLLTALAKSAETTAEPLPYSAVEDTK